MAVLVYKDGNHILSFFGLALIFSFTISPYSLKMFKASDMVDANDFVTFLDEFAHEDIVVERVSIFL